MLVSLINLTDPESADKVPSLEDTAHVVGVYADGDDGDDDDDDLLFSLSKVFGLADEETVAVLKS